MCDNANVMNNKAVLDRRIFGNGKPNICNSSVLLCFVALFVLDFILDFDDMLPLYFSSHLRCRILSNDHFVPAKFRTKPFDYFCSDIVGRRVILKGHEKHWI